MGHLSNRLARIEASLGQSASGLTDVEIMIVDPSPAGPIYTGDVIMMRAGQRGTDGRAEFRPELAGMPAAGKA